MSITVVIIDLIITIFALILFSNLFTQFSFGVYEIIFFTLLKQTGLNFPWSINKGGQSVLFRQLMGGNFNSYLTKPINSFIFYTFKGIKMRWVVMGLIMLSFMLTFVLYTNLPFLKFLFVLFFSVLIFGYLFISIIYFLDSFAFYNIKIKGSNIVSINMKLTNFPPTIYEQFNYKFIFFFFPLVLYGVSTLYYFDTLSLKSFLSTLFIAFSLSLIFNILTYFIWKYGLKRYEAFG